MDLRGEDPLVAETRLVAEAEAALARGEPARARDLARDLARAFPKGQLTLEREAIELCARCGLGEPGAGQAARAFLSTHADAPVAARVRARCESTLKSLGQ